MPAQKNPLRPLRRLSLSLSPLRGAEKSLRTCKGDRPTGVWHGDDDLVTLNLAVEFPARLHLEVSALCHKQTSHRRAVKGPTASSVLRYAVPTSLIPHQHTRVPEVQTTGETTPVQQIVYAESLTTSGGSSA